MKSAEEIKLHCLGVILVVVVVKIVVLKVAVFVKEVILGVFFKKAGEGLVVNKLSLDQCQLLGGKERRLSDRRRKAPRKPQAVFWLAVYT